MNGLKNPGPFGSFSLALFGDPAQAVPCLFTARVPTPPHSIWSVEEERRREGKQGYTEGSSFYVGSSKKDC